MNPSDEHSDENEEENEEDEEETEDEEEDEDEDEDEDEEPAKSDLALISEDYVVLYQKTVFAAPEDALVIKGKAIEFRSASDLNSVFRSKSPSRWENVGVENIFVFSGDRLPSGKFETFLYVLGFVKGDERDDHRILRTVHPTLAEKLIYRFNTQTDAAARGKYEAVFEWVSPPSGPQLNPAVSRWKKYGRLSVMTNFERRSVLASRKRTCDRVKGEFEKKTKKARHVELSGDAKTPYFTYKLVEVADGDKTHVFIKNNVVHILELK
jgi:hypothetical protein